MILVVAARSDAGAHALVERWPRDQARVLTVDDLTTSGWRVGTGDPADARAVVRGDVVPPHRITGVLTRLPAVTERELPTMVEEDRAYAAAEMTAFLSYWLSSVDCPVLNRPTASSLCGPGWRPEHWVLRASRLGIPARPRHHHVPVYGQDARAPADDPSPTHREVTVVGDRCVGDQDTTLTGWARGLAAAAEVDLLTVLFDQTGLGPRLVHAHPWADVNDPETAAAILEYFTVERKT